jgi:alkylated DNA repair dioxygenase AlkB
MQYSIFDANSAGFDDSLNALEHMSLPPGAWIDACPNWLGGHMRLFHELIHVVSWRHQQRMMYERMVMVPRLVASAPTDGWAGSIISEMAECLSSHYDRRISRASLAYYRNGNDSVAMHGDRVGDRKQDSIIAIVSIGAPRRFLLKSNTDERSHKFDLGWGDLLVMGGDCQATWQHGVPKRGHADPRISIQFREPLLGSEP